MALLLAKFAKLSIIRTKGIVMKKICFCYGYTDTDIIEDVLKNKGRSTIYEKIMDA